MKILALDIATKTGWCTETASGVWNFAIKRDESSGFRLVRFKAKLSEIVQLEKIDTVVFERSAGFHMGAVIIQSEIHGICKLFCEENNIQYKAYSAGEIKKFASGKGNSNKAAMIKAAQDKFGYKGNDDNEADAICIYHLAMDDFKFIQPPVANGTNGVLIGTYAGENLDKEEKDGYQMEMMSKGIVIPKPSPGTGTNPSGRSVNKISHL